MTLEFHKRRGDSVQDYTCVEKVIKSPVVGPGFQSGHEEACDVDPCRMGILRSRL